MHTTSDVGVANLGAEVDEIDCGSGCGNDSWEGYVDGGEEHDQLLMAREEEQERPGILPLHIERSRMAQCDAQQHALINDEKQKRKLQELEERRVRMRTAMASDDELDVVRNEWWSMFREDRDVGGSQGYKEMIDPEWQMIMEECERECMGKEDKRCERECMGTTLKWGARVLRDPS